jgi:hypothetical protein
LKSRQLTALKFGVFIVWAKQNHVDVPRFHQALYTFIQVPHTAINCTHVVESISCIVM